MTLVMKQDVAANPMRPRFVQCDRSDVLTESGLELDLEAVGV